jgi:hypothetical protein
VTTIYWEPARPPFARELFFVAWAVHIMAGECTVAGQRPITPTYRGARSLNGTRVADSLLANVPRRDSPAERRVDLCFLPCRSAGAVGLYILIVACTLRRDQFKIALRMLKYWTKMRGLYGNKLGYLGGVQIAILTARICQLYPCAAASTIVMKLFKVLLVFAKPPNGMPAQWSAEKPIKLCDEQSRCAAQ